jgi:hypothetical protein
MAEYLILIYGDEQQIAAGGPALWEQLHKEHVAFGQAHEKSIRGGNALERAETATSIRRRDDGSQTVTDGPFAETKEVLGGYYLVEASDLDAALAIARDVPTPFGGVEVRPVQVIDMGH